MTEAGRTSEFKPETAYMEVPRCQQCRWWDAIGARDHRRDVVGLCALFSNPDHPVAFCTSEDFGCVRFEAAAQLVLREVR